MLTKIVIKFVQKLCIPALNNKSLVIRSPLNLFLPDLFYLPELLVNNEGFDFGVKQSGERVDNVLLPAWAHGDPRLFIKIHRQALESDHVRGTLRIPITDLQTRKHQIMDFIIAGSCLVGSPLFKCWSK